MAINVTPYSLVDKYRPFVGQIPTFCGNFLVSYSGLKDVLKMEAAGYPEKLVTRSFATQPIPK